MNGRRPLPRQVAWLAARLRGHADLAPGRRSSGGEGASRRGSQHWDSDGSDGGRGGHQPARGQPRKSAFAAEVTRTLRQLEESSSAAAAAGGAAAEAPGGGSLREGGGGGERGGRREAQQEEAGVGEEAEDAREAPEPGAEYGEQQGARKGNAAADDVVG